MDQTLEAGAVYRITMERTCRSCLSIDRRTSSVVNIDFFASLTGVVELEARLCWECQARLRSAEHFHRQTDLATKLLHSAVVGDKSPPCLSRLGYAHKDKFDYTYSAELSLQADETAVLPAPAPCGDVALDVCDDAIVCPKAELIDYPEWDHEPLIFEVPAVEPTPVRRRKKKERESADRAEEELDSDLEKICTRVVETRPQFVLRRAARARGGARAGARHVCEACGVSFHAGAGLHRHRLELHAEGGLACPSCDCLARDAAALAAHAACHRRLRCLRCRYTSPSEHKMRRHAGTHEQRPVCIPCDVCGKVLKNRQHFAVHRKAHTSDQRYECDHCGRVYSTRNQMFRHLRMHRKPFLCEVCGKTFSDKSYLASHSLAHEGPEARKAECDICKKRFINKYKLEVHMRWHTGEKPYECDVCGRSYREKSQLVEHRKRHEPDAQPAKRARRFERTKSVFVNPRGGGRAPAAGAVAEGGGGAGRARARAPPHVCNFCGKSFKDKWRLKFHLAVHSDDRAYKCDECDLTFKYQSGLWTHKLVHKGGKPHQCTICGAQFTQKGNLTAHLKIHTDEKPFECNICGNKFRMRRNLRNHFKIHANVDKTPF